MQQGQLPMTMRFNQSFTAEPHNIDELGHVNNTVWLAWVQDIATSHWEAAADPAHIESFIWVVIRHEIDYRGNIAAGESVTGTTWIPDPAKGAKSDRCVEFRNEAGKVLVAARTTWAMLDKESQRLVRVRDDVMAPFQPSGE